MSHRPTTVLAAIQGSRVPIRASQISKATRLSMREVDRTLQRLRRAGIIQYISGSGSGWQRVTRATKAT